MLISEVPGKEATKAFAEKLSSLPAGFKIMLLSSLALRGDKSAAAQVAAEVNSADDAVRIAAISALGALGGISDIELLAQQSIAPGQIGRAAERSLSILSGEGVSEGLLKAAQSGDAEVRAKIIDCLVTRQQKDAVPVLIKLAEDKNLSVRKASFKALGSLAEQQDIAAIVSLLIKNTSSSERLDLEQSLVFATGRFEDKKSSIDVIIAGLNEADDAAKVNLLSVLSKLGGEEAYKTVCGCLKSDNTDVRKGAIRALSDWPDAAPAANLLDIAKNDTDNTSAILALRGYIRLVSLPSERFNRQTVDLLKGAFKLAKRPDEKKTVLNVLPNFACPEALELAKSALNDNDTSAEAEIAVQKLESMSLIAAASKVSTSGGTNIPMINDQIIPKGQNDDMVSFHWWPKSGTKEWVQYDFGDKQKVSAVEVYWFDDTGRGSCRVPQSWQILYRENGEFKPVNNASGFGVERDKFNKAVFEPVETDALRLEVQLQSNESCGIHEWRIE